MARPKKIQVVKVYSLAEEVSSLLKQGLLVSVICKELPKNNSGKLTVGSEYEANETVIFCRHNYISVLTEAGVFWYSETRFEMSQT